MNQPYLLGPDTEGDFANKTRIADAAAEIAEALRAQFGRDSPCLRDILRKTESWNRGLTQLEVVLSLQVALSIFQVELVNMLAAMHLDADDGEDEL